MTAKPAAPALVTTRCSPARVRLQHVEQTAQRLSTRDTQIVDTINRLRLATGAQLERLHFTDLSPTCRSRVRRRVLHRLVSWRVLATLPRRVGGIRAGSTGLTYTLDTTGAWLIRLQAATAGHNAPRRASQPGAAFTAHTLAVSELYVQLVERARTSGFHVAVFDAEPACWWPDDLGGHLKPDAHALLAADGYQDAWWIEVDQATETLPRLRKKLQTYLDFQRRGGIGPAGVLPRVLITTPNAQRCTAITDLITGLPPPADQLFRAVLHEAAAELLIHTLTQP
jgi:Replication-relaxation